MPELVKLYGRSTFAKLYAGGGKSEHALPPLPSNARVLVLKPDRLVADLIVRAVRMTCGSAKVQIAISIAEARPILRDQPVDLLITDVVATDGNALDYLMGWTTDPALVRRVFVVTDRKEPAVLQILMNMHLVGIFDQTGEDMVGFTHAFRVVARGFRFVSSSVVDRVRVDCMGSDSMLRKLSPTQRLVLGTIGMGCDDQTAGEQLGMKASSVATFRRDLHRILGVRHRGELMHIAQKLGFIINTAYGTIRPGYMDLMDERTARKAKQAEQDAPR